MNRKSWNLMAGFSAGQSLIDDFDGLSWHARSLQISTYRSGQIPQGPALNTGDITLQVDFLGAPATAIRRFQIGAWQTVVLDIGSFAGARVTILETTLSGFSLAAVATEEYPSLTDDSPMLLREEVSAGAHNVPPGADRLWPTTADAGFSWEIGTTAMNIPTVVGTEQAVRGLRYITTASPFVGFWRIRL